MDQTARHEPSSAWRPKVLLVDEYQALEPKVLRELMSTHERCRIPLALSGNKERLANSKRDAVAVAQIENRIGPRVFLDRPTAEACESIGVEFNVEGRDAYQALAFFGGNTTVRDLVRLLEICTRNNEGGGSIRLSHLETAVLGLYGNSNALRLLAGEPHPSVAAA